MIGSTLSHYRIVDKLGQGGMGVVYKAEDTKLDRTVAIKVLPSAALASADDRERFYREAKSAAALNHPHIAQVYEIDEAVPSDAPHGTDPSPFIAMEFIDGAPLDEAVKDSPLKLSTAVALSIQIAQALEAAHDKDIVHRDIKSANVMLTAKGQAKVLDFGLAKTAHSTMLTRMGSTLGTVAYMSPEQARGEDVDHRTDLWALGVVLYELVSGKNPFGGDYEQAVVYSILNEAPEPLTAVRTGVPMQLEWIVDKCLAKDADDRYQSAKDLIVDLRKVDITSGSGTNQMSTASMAATHTSKLASSPQARTATPPTQPWTWAAVALVLGIVLTAAIMTATRPAREEPQLTQVDLSLNSLFFVRFPSMSPTGEYLAVQALNQEGQKGIFLRTMSTGEMSFVRGSDNAGDREMGFSPDGSRLAYNAASNEGLFVMDVPSGIPAPLTEFGRFAYWESDDVIVMTDDRAGGGESYRVRLADPDPEVIEVADAKLSEGYSNVLKTNVPGTYRAFGHQLIRVSGGNQDVTEPANIYAFDSKSGELTIIAQNAINPYYVGGGFLAYQIGDDNGPLVVRQLNGGFDGFEGPPVDVLTEGIANWGDYSITPRGDLLYINSGTISLLSNRLWEANLSDQTVEEIRDLVPANGFVLSPEISPDGRFMATSFQSNSGSVNVHLVDLQRKTGQQLTFQHINYEPVFSHDSSWLYWTQKEEDSPGDTHRVPVNQSSGPELFLENAVAVKFSPDGNWMVFSRPNGNRATMIIRDMRSHRDTVLDSTSAFPIAHDFSPDSRYLVYSSDYSTSSQLTVVSIDGNENYQLPNTRGNTAVFSEDGQFLMIEAGRSLYRMPVRIEPTFSVRGIQELILSTPYSSGFDLHGNDQVFVSSAAVQFAGATENKSSLIWRQNWSTYLQEELGK